MGGGLELVARAGRGRIDNAVEPQVPLEQRIGLAGKADGVDPRIASGAAARRMPWSSHPWVPHVKPRGFVKTIGRAHIAHM